MRCNIEAEWLTIFIRSNIYFLVYKYYFIYTFKKLLQISHLYTSCLQLLTPKCFTLRYNICPDDAFHCFLVQLSYNWVTLDNLVENIEIHRLEKYYNGGHLILSVQSSSIFTCDLHIDAHLLILIDTFFAVV